MKKLLIALCAFICPASSAAQIIPNISLYSTYTDNLFLSSSKRADWIHLAYIDLDYALNEDFGVYYSGSANHFADNGDLFNQLHQFGFSLARPFGQSATLYAGAEFGLRLDRPLYDYREFGEMRAYASAKTYLNPNQLLRVSYSARRQNFLNADEYSFYEQNFNLQLTRFLPTRTTLQLSGELGWKTYVSEGEDFSFVDFEVPARFGQDRHLLQWVTGAKVGQSIGGDFGLQLQWIRRDNISGESRFLSDLFYNSDDDLFDDRYSYSGQHLGTTLKYLAPWGLGLAATYERQTRAYSSRPAYDLEGVSTAQSQRETRNSVRFGLERAFFFERGWAREIGIEAEYLYRNINSNDPYYDANARAYTLGIQLGF